MASRIGKYKVSKKESAMSIIDGGTVTGNVTFSGSLTLGNLSVPTATSSLSVNQLFRTGSAILSASAASGGSAGAPNTKHFDILCIRNVDGSTGGH